MGGVFKKSMGIGFLCTRHRRGGKATATGEPDTLTTASRCTAEKDDKNQRGVCFCFCFCFYCIGGKWGGVKARLLVKQWIFFFFLSFFLLFPLLCS
jgi:hypothetical protein